MQKERIVLHITHIWISDNNKNYISKLQKHNKLIDLEAERRVYAGVDA